ncbi:GFA family protein [Pseudomonas sp. O64]|uniref:GFA family protein n=1 Tax=Pseudomonas TaxID=286 RepID=UPI000BA1807A|nr:MULTISPECIES: GFA family protein [unclassified Pseudomonas]MCV2230318.1 GFA family protein [Pseudomonas sp. AU10]OZO02097.1 ribulose phosphate epimerase [Pseudomonas sp. IB20]UNM22512.1 GFA family protein [Pseudomonas sp. ArH3a]UXZ25144.1 GFA family protein [Pseudomonas sp. YeP6b]
MDAVTQGSCLCGAINYQVSTRLKAVTHCHCKKCQKGHGAAFSTYASAPKSALNVNASPDTLRSYESSQGVTRQFCSRCGSSLFWSDANGLYRGWVSIALGTLDTPFVARNQAHSCLESKAAWFCEDSV